MYDEFALRLFKPGDSEIQLHARSSEPRFPRGSVGPEQLRAREAGADDHSLQTANWESVLGEFAAEA